jgi:pimeloyl-ACP methyl ester carboxylesterase
VREVHTGEVAVGGVRSPLIQAGAADAPEAVVFLHGNPGSRLDWEDLVARVGELGRTLAFDMPGFGQSDEPRDFDYRIEGYAEFIDGALEELGVRDVHLVMHDLGGPFGICWAAGHPDRLQSAVLFNTGTATHHKWHRMGRLWRRPVVGELVMAATNRRAWRRSFARAKRPLPASYVDRMYDDFDRGTRRAVLRVYRAMDLPYPPAPGWVETLRGLDRPALIVWGANDPFVGRGRIEQVREAFPSADVVVLEDSGHFPFADDPDQAAEAVVPFLRTQLGAGAPA